MDSTPHQHLHTHHLPPLDRGGRRDAVVLAGCQALYVAAVAIEMTLTGLAGARLAPLPILAMLPFALITVSGACWTVIASFLLQRLGRRAGFALGAATGAVGGLLSAMAMVGGAFWLLMLGSIASGAYQAFAEYYRLAAADAVDDDAKGRAVAIVLAGGVVAAIAGPALASWSQDLVPIGLYAGAYLAVAALGAGALLLLLGLYRGGDHVIAARASAITAPRPLRRIVAQPMFLAAAANLAMGSMVMMAVMAAAPLAAVACGYSVGDSAHIIRWHLLGMFVPAFLSGWLVDRFDLPVVMLGGTGLTVLCAAIAVSSDALEACFAALLVLGVGWNFMQVGGAALLTRCCTPSERAATQACAELARYAVSAIGVLAAAPLLDAVGWASLNLLMVPLLVPALAATAWWMASERSSPSTVR